MNIRISTDSDVPVHEQIAAQFLFQIGTGVLQPGAMLPSVRALARLLGVHRNTICRAYQDPTLNLVAEKRAGARLRVRAPDVEALPRTGLDRAIAAAIASARRQGYSTQQIHERWRAHLMAAPPDHLLALSDDPGMRLLLPAELRRRVTCRIDVCSPAELLSQPDRAIGALVISPQGHIARIRAIPGADLQVIAIGYSGVDEHIEAIRRLELPSLVVVVSVSPYFLEMARRLLAQAVGNRHSMRSYLMANGQDDLPGAGDFLLCDCITYPIVRSQSRSATVVVHNLMTSECLDLVVSRLAAPSAAGGG
jgi:GntR family transcriptional regulator